MEKDVEEIVDTLHDSPVGTGDPNLVFNEEPHIVEEPPPAE